MRRAHCRYREKASSFTTVSSMACDPPSSQQVVTDWVIHGRNMSVYLLDIYRSSLSSSRPQMVLWVPGKACPVAGQGGVWSGWYRLVITHTPSANACFIFGATSVLLFLLISFFLLFFPFSLSEFSFSPRARNHLSF